MAEVVVVVVVKVFLLLPPKHLQPPKSKPKLVASSHWTCERERESKPLSVTSFASEGTVQRD